MAFVKKTWKDRLVEYAGRRTLKRISGSPESQMVVDVTRNEGTVSQAGDAFSAANMNDLEQRILDGFTEVNNDLNGCRFTAEGSGANTKYYVQNGADTASKKPLDSIDLLWTNPSPSASFAPQTLPLDLSKYKSVLIRCKLNASPYVYDFAQDYSKFSIPDATRRCAATAYGKIDGGWYYTLGYRNATVSKSGITFETGYYYETGNHVLVPSDAFCVPQAIYGIASDNF